MKLSADTRGSLAKRALGARKSGLYTGLPTWAPGFSGAAQRPQSGSIPPWRSASSRSIVAARGFSLVEFGLFATVLAATGFFQSLLDLTVEDSLTKYGFRYVVAEDWGASAGSSGVRSS